MVSSDSGIQQLRSKNSLTHAWCDNAGNSIHHYKNKLSGSIESHIVYFHSSKYYSIILFYSITFISIFHLTCLLIGNHLDIYRFGVPDVIITINYQPITITELKVLKLQSGMALTLTFYCNVKTLFYLQRRFDRKTSLIVSFKPTGNNWL